jgi:hypothetical protein
MTTKATIINQARRDLKDEAGTIWKPVEMDKFLEIVLREVEDVEPMPKEVNLPLTEYTWNVKTISLTDLHEIFKVWYPAGQASPIRRNAINRGGFFRLKLNSVPQYTAGLLTGIVTFTNGSNVVTGSGTLFETELTDGLEGYLIAVSAASRYYQIAEIVSDTELRLFDDFEETTIVDGNGATKLRDVMGCARIEYGGSYTVSPTICNLPLKLMNAVVLGLVGHASMQLAAYYSKGILDNITTDRASVIEYVDTFNVGGDVAGKYNELIKNQAATASSIGTYKNWAELKWREYQAAKDTLGLVKSYEECSPEL